MHKFLFGLSLYFYLIATVFALETIPMASDNDQFLPVLNRTLYIRNLNFSQQEIESFKHKTLKRILKVPIDKFLAKSSSFEKNQELIAFDFQLKSSYTYKFSEFVYLISFDIPSKSILSNTSLILSNDNSVHAQLNNEYLERGILTGFAYSGKMRNHSIFKEVKLSAINLDDKKSLINDGEMEFLKTVQVKRAKIFDFLMFIYDVSKKPYGNFSKVRFFFSDPSKRNIGFRRDSYAFDPATNSIVGYSLFKDTVIFRIFETLEGEEEAQYLVICKKSKLEIVELGGPFTISNMDY